MSSSSSLTPDEKDEEIRKAASLSDDMVKEDARWLIIMGEPMKKHIATQQRVEQEQTLLDSNTAALDILNTNTSIVDKIKTQLMRESQIFITQNKQAAVEKSLKNRFDALLATHSANPILREIDRLRHHYTGGSSRAIPDSIVQVLVDLKEAELMTPARMQVAQDYYRHVIMTYLRKKMYDAYKAATKLDTKHTEIEAILKKLNGLLYKPYDKSTFSALAVELKQVVGTEFSIPLRDKTGNEFSVKMNFLKIDTAAKVMEMEGILTDQYTHFDKFEKRMMDYRGKQYSSFKKYSLIYTLLPDTMAKIPLSKEPVSDDMTPQKEANHFPHVKDKEEHRLSENAYKDYQRKLLTVDFTADSDAESKAYRAAVTANIDTAIQNNFSEGVMQILAINLKKVHHVEDDVLGVILAVMVKVLATDRYPEPDFSDPKFDSIFNEKTVIGIFDKLEEYTADRHVGHRELKNHLALFGLDSHIPDVLANLIADKVAAEKFKVEIRQYHHLQAEYDRAENSRKELQTEANIQLDRSLIDLLRAQVLHAATLYFNPAEKPGLMHGLHHSSSGRESVLALIHQLFAPEVTTFAKAVAHLRTFMARQKETKGLHTNSFDTLLSYVLYNEGTPRGLFHLKLSEVMAFNVSRFYPGYRSNDIHYRHGSGSIVKANIEAIKTYLNIRYVVPGAVMKGRVSSMVRGQTRLEKSADLNIVRQQLVANLVSRAQLVEEFKAGYDIEARLNAASSAPQGRL